MLTGRSKTPLRAFALGSVILHGLALAGWQASPWMAGQANSVLSVTLISDRTVAAPAETRLTTPSTHKTVRRADSIDDEPSVGTAGTRDRTAQGTALLAASAKTKPMSMASRTEDSRPMEEGVAFAKKRRAR